MIVRANVIASDRMRYPPEHKEQVRKHLLAKAGSFTKRNGFASSGVDALAAAAGLTTGSLYKHFDGKASLFVAMLDAEFQRLDKIYAKISPEDREAVLKHYSKYLSLYHVDHPESGCPLPSLAADAGRADVSARAAFERGLLNIKERKQLTTGSSDKAWAILALEVGAVMLARAVRSKATQREILEAIELEGRRYLDGSSDAA